MGAVNKINLTSSWISQRPSWKVSLSVTLALAALVITAVVFQRYRRSAVPQVTPDSKIKTPYFVTSKTVRVPLADPSSPLSTSELPKAQWGGELGITQTMIDRVKEVLPLSYTNPEIVWVKGFFSNKTFSLPSMPDLIFITAGTDGYDLAGKIRFDNELIDYMFENIKKGEKVCKTHNLHLLVIPRTSKLEAEVQGKKYTLLVQERLKYNPETQKEEYYKHAQTMVETFRQLTAFVALTGAERMEWINMPIVNPDFPGAKQVALLAWVFMENSKRGIFGRAGYPAPGLVGSAFSEEQLDVVFEEAASKGVTPPADTSEETQKTSMGRKKIRLQEIEYYHQLCLFHEEKGIIQNPQKPVAIDTDDLNLEEQAIDANLEALTMKQVLKSILTHINESIQTAPEEASLEHKRFIVLERKFLSYYSLGFSGDFRSLYLKNLTDNQLKKLWIHRILQMLLDQEQIYSFGITVRDEYFYLQA